MKLVQKKFLRPCFEFEIDNQRLRVKSKRMFSSNSFEVKISELCSDRSEESNFAIGWLLSGLIFSGLGLWLLLAGLNTPVTDDGGALLGTSFIPLILSIISFVGFYRRTYSYVLLCREDTRLPVVSFYKDNPSQKELDEYIKRLRSLIDGDEGLGFKT